MDDMAGKLSEILSDPAQMEKLKAMASALFNDSTENETHNQHESVKGSEHGLSLPDGFDPVRLMSIFSALKDKRSDNRTELLLALKPHLSNDRQDRVEKAVKLLKMASLLPILKEQGILDDLF